jgi:hypothetical protein
MRICHLLPRLCALVASVGIWAGMIDLAAAQAPEIIRLPPPEAEQPVFPNPPELPPDVGSPPWSEMPVGAAIVSPGPYRPGGPLLPAASAPGFAYHLGGKARSYYINDQRIEFTGLEATFAVEGVVNGGLQQQVGEWTCQVESELFLNQPFDRNVLVDSPLRASFAHNFDVDPLQISQLYMGARRNDLYFACGRFVSPFGRYYYPIYRNNFDDSPFIRSESILYRETGVLAQWDPGSFVFTAALTNGGFNQDTNSSKALIARAATDLGWFVFGKSIKIQDGIGSEGQKQFNEHAGLDAMVRLGAWTLSGEVIYDRYGLRRPGTDLNDITWGRSLYFRDLNNGFNRPISGVGYYVNLGYEGPQWSWTFNYGEFYPEQLGVPNHDAPTHRGIVKASRHWTPSFETYSVLLVENTLPGAFDGHDRKGIYLVAGLQLSM